MFNILPLILILLSLACIIFIVVRKFAVLANLDIESIQAERETKIKEQIISSRLKRTYYKYYNIILKAIKPAGGLLAAGFKKFYEKLLDFKDNYNKSDEADILESSKADEERIIVQARELKENEDWDEAEKKYIKIIGQDSGNIEAFRGLGEVYYARKDFYEAKETMEHAEKLMEKKYNDLSIEEEKGELSEEKKEEKDRFSTELAAIYFDLCLVEKAIEDYQEALKNINKALKIQPNNPRYLDTKFEVSIINKDKISALEAYENLAKVNPDNNKLAGMKAKLSEM